MKRQVQRLEDLADGPSHSIFIQPTSTKASKTKKIKIEPRSYEDSQTLKMKARSAMSQVRIYSPLKHPKKRTLKGILHNNNDELSKVTLLDKNCVSALSGSESKNTFQNHNK